MKRIETNTNSSQIVSFSLGVISYSIFVSHYYWIANFDWGKSINEGLNRNENHLIFFSQNLEKDADFSLPVYKGSFDPSVDRCYFGKLVRAFSK